MPGVSPSLVVVVDLLVALSMLAAGAYALTVPSLTRRYRLFVTLPLLDAALLAAFVFGEDSYRGNGVSRWDAYRSPGGELSELFGVTIAVLIGCGLALAYSSVRGRRRLFAAAAFVTVLAAVFLVLPTVVGFSAN